MTNNSALLSIQAEDFGDFSGAAEFSDFGSREVAMGGGVIQTPLSIFCIDIITNEIY